MKVELFKKPKGVTMIEGFPGFGLVGTIATEFLLDHLEVEQIGRIISKKLPAMIAVHSSRIIEPLGIYYSKKYNLVIQHAVTNIGGIEWDLAEALLDVAKQLQAKEIISLEGVGTLPGMGPSTGKAGAGASGKGKAFYYSNIPRAVKKFEGLGLEQLKEGIIMGVTGVLSVTAKQNFSCIFAPTQSKLPDSRAAAKIIEILDGYLGLDVPYKPLIKKAEKFEAKLKEIFSQAQNVMEQKQDKERVGYIT